MKKRKPKIADKKLRGEWAEMVFMVRATEHGLQVSKPWGEMRSYDFVVGRPRHFVSVQVKSTIAELDDDGYGCTVRGGHKPYPPGSFDFLAAYVVHDNAWYIIPEEKILGLELVTLYPKSEKAKYEKYREAWHLLDPDADTTGGHIDSIQGCAEEFSSDEVGEGEHEERGILGMDAILARFSSDFHKEVLSSTVSAQGRNAFLLRVAAISPKVDLSNT